MVCLFVFTINVRSSLSMAANVDGMKSWGLKGKTRTSCATCLMVANTKINTGGDYKHKTKNYGNDKRR